MWLFYTSILSTLHLRLYPYNSFFYTHLYPFSTLIFSLNLSSHLSTSHTFTISIFYTLEGCSKGTVVDWWKMCWQVKCRRIVMLTNLVERGAVSVLYYLFYHYYFIFNNNKYKIIIIISLLFLMLFFCSNYLIE